MKTLLENVLETKFEISKTFKIKQDQRNNLKTDVETAIVKILADYGVECKEVEKALAFKIENIGSKTPKQYIPVKIAVSIPSVDFDIDLENRYLLQDRENKRLEKIEKAEKKAKKIERDKALREKVKAEKLKALETE